MTQDTYDIITDSKELKRRIDALNKEKYVAIDTEFLRERTYYPTLCLIQIAGSVDAFAIDTLAKDIDLKPFIQLMANKKILKLFHACSQDMEIIYNISGKLPTPVFDTQIAAQMLGHGEAVSYAKLVDHFREVELDKTSRHTDWSKRPLSPTQIEYAISDVTHLYEFYELMKKELEELGRFKWATEEMKDILNVKNYQINPDDVWLKLKTRNTSPLFRSIVKEVTKWREIKAMDTNKPRQWILRDDAILEIAAAAPETLDKLKKLRFASRGLKGHDDEILAAVKRGKKAKPPAAPEKKKHLPKGCAPLVDLLKLLLKIQSDYHDVAASVIARTEDLEEIAMSKKPRNAAMKGWRYDIFGKYAILLKESKLAITAQGNRAILIEPDYGK